MHAAIHTVSENGVNLRVLVRCQPSHITVVRSNSIDALARSVDLIIYYNPCHAVELNGFVC